ncbi:MAG: hypothetical protein NTW56_20540 [Alphaproteobacteria bacterium]|nr:hypothetical protein [Alphaproteobacteria bacterium]
MPQPIRMARARSRRLHRVKEADITIRQDFNDVEDWYAAWLSGQGFVGAFPMAISPPNRARLLGASRAAWGKVPCGFAATARLAIGMAA